MRLRLKKINKVNFVNSYRQFAFNRSLAWLAALIQVR